MALLVVYAGEQLACAAFDWELHPRRAFPVVLIAMLTTDVLCRSWHLRRFQFWSAQVVVGGIFGAFLLLVVRARLAPRPLPWVVGAVYAISMIARFVWK